VCSFCELTWKGGNARRHSALRVHCVGPSIFRIWPVEWRGVNMEAVVMNRAQGGQHHVGAMSGRTRRMPQSLGRVHRPCRRSRRAQVTLVAATVTICSSASPMCPRWPHHLGWWRKCGACPGHQGRCRVRSGLQGWSHCHHGGATLRRPRRRRGDQSRPRGGKCTSIPNGLTWPIGCSFCCKASWRRLSGPRPW
jgi:hypothetical protein